MKKNPLNFVLILLMLFFFFIYLFSLSQVYYTIYYDTPIPLPPRETAGHEYYYDTWIRAEEDIIQRVFWFFVYFSTALTINFILTEPYKKRSVKYSLILLLFHSFAAMLMIWFWYTLNSQIQTTSTLGSTRTISIGRGYIYCSIAYWGMCLTGLTFYIYNINLRLNIIAEIEKPKVKIKTEEPKISKKIKIFKMSKIWKYRWIVYLTLVTISIILYSFSFLFNVEVILTIILQFTLIPFFEIIVFPRLEQMEKKKEKKV